MKNQGIPDEEIVEKLTEQGISPKAINEALAQSQVKSAVSDIEIQEQAPPASSGTYAPQTQEMSGQETYAPQAQNYSQAQEGYPQESYGYSGGGATDIDTMIEISEQVFSEKIQKIQKKVDDLNEFKTLAQTKIDHTSERLKRVETTMDKLQIAILDKIGSYGKNLESMKKEMSMMQNSFGKMVGKVVEKAAAHHTTSAKKTVKKKTSKKK
ncbi:MAG TPA: hypothetical protein ENG87_03415 [Candidatus Pacearchaeota archaeon]|nr:hypothetical protein BMS3Abin17_00523 [archaeon BMS3Abin17]HDK42402.1 hypothetical protein [Candidatus Pacearchaeota archaeon]